jgi:hypothetical protein
LSANQKNMKKLLLSFVSIAAALSAHSQCSEIFMSEIVEGWSNNKAVEIYNPTANTVSLNGYGIVRFDNGSTTYGQITPFDGLTIAPYDVLVVVLDKRDSLGTGLEAPVWDELQAAADVFVSPTYDNGVWAMYFNGNDALAIVKNNGQTLVDLFGRIGEGTGFGGWSPLGTLDSQGNPTYASKDHTMIRKADVTSGVSTNPSSFDVFAQYDTLPANTFDFLGVHNCNCGTVGMVNSNKDAFNVYPNPVKDGSFSVVADQGIDQLSIYTLNGQLVNRQNEINDIMLNVDVRALTAGMYWVEVRFQNGDVVRKKLIK